MTSEELRRLLEARPFQPFVIRTGDGREPRVSHPEAVGYSGRIATYIHPSGGVEIFDLFLVSSLFPDVTSPGTPTDGNGGEG
jgi:hypothetical protein